MTAPIRPLILIILDGWGYREDTTFNAISAASKPNWDHFWKTYPHTVLCGSGNAVGLPAGQMGNSEVGHMTIGSGRVIYQDLTRIDQAISDGRFFKNELLISTFKKLKSSQKALHIMGLLSPGGVHSHERHFIALIKLAAEYDLSSVYIHAFLDGRDTPPRSAKASLENLDHNCRQLNCGRIVLMEG